ncbi:MAG: GNAT family N-acetyltransferase [Candidatus Sulfotelmatobacter sp.]
MSTDISTQSAISYGNLPRGTDTSVSIRQRFSVSVIRSYQEVEQLRQTWAGWQRHPNADIDFYLLVCRSRPEILRPHVIVLYREGRPEAMLVGRLVKGTIDLSVGYGKMLKVPARLLTIVYGGLLGDLSSENCKILVTELSYALRRDEADAALFNFVRTDSDIYRSMLGVPGPTHRDYWPSEQLHRSMKLPDNIETVYREMSGDHRKELRRMEKRLLSDHSGDMRVTCLRDVGELDRMFLDLEEIARGTYQRGLGAGFADTPEMRQRFHLEAERGWLRSYILYVAGKPCAFWVGTLYKDTFHSGFMGYDSTYQRYSPGSVLQIKVVEDLCRNGIKELDFGLGDAMYKRRFGNCSWQEASAYMFAPSLTATAINFVRTPTIFADRILRRVLSRTKLLEKVKKGWRTRVRKR